MTQPTEMGFWDKAFSLVALWVSRAAGAALMFAGSMWLLGGIDKMLAYAISAFITFYISKEIM